MRLSFTFINILFSILCCLLLASGNVSSASKEKPSQGKYTEIEWVDLIPEADLDALSNPPEYLNDIQDGSFEDQLSSQISNQITDSLAQAADSRYQQALISTEIKPEYNNRKIRLPGFIVPLQTNKEQRVTEFFLVPYFGACIHVPPPPPNQIVYVTYPKGVDLKTLYDPFWISGTLSTKIKSNDLGTSAYAMQADKAVLYEEK